MLFLLTWNVRQAALMLMLSLSASSTMVMKLNSRRNPAKGVFFVSEK
jgi:hypothetical protein